ncbi:MAG: DUF721 domain-containing protein [Gammaproteobacteria bacterium]|nr:DUF721 domain-containing protein [Gammaproteobacteria bacterium]
MDSFNSRLDDSLRKRALELQHLTSLLRGELPPETDGHYHVANIQDRTLVIMTDSPVWTTRIRQLGPRVLTILKNSGRKDLLHIRVFCRPAQSAPVEPVKPATSPPRQISQQSCRLLEQTASFIQDEGLSDALQKLARHYPEKNAKDNDA